MSTQLSTERPFEGEIAERREAKRPKLTAAQLKLSADQIPLNHLIPVLQELGKFGVTIGDLARIGSDDYATRRVARGLQTDGWPLTPTEAMAVDILGPENVLLADALSKALGLYDPPFETRNVPYTRATLYHCADQNKLGQEWRLVFLFAMAPQAVLEHSKKLSHFPESRENIGQWIKHYADCPPAEYRRRLLFGYALLNWRTLFLNRQGSCEYMTVEEQEQAVRECHPGCSRALAETVFEAWTGEILLKGRLNSSSVREHLSVLRQPANSLESASHVVVSYPPSSFTNHMPMVKVLKAGEKVFGGTMVCHLPTR